MSTVSCFLSPFLSLLVIPCCLHAAGLFPCRSQPLMVHDSFKLQMNFLPDTCKFHVQILHGRREMDANIICMCLAICLPRLLQD